MIRVRLSAIVLFVFGASGCAYYNGIYNANQLRDEARKAEREGRPGEARSLWARVIIKADTVLARYPESERRFDAHLLRGTAMLELGACDQSIPSLEEVAAGSSNQELVDEASLFLGECYLEMGRLDSSVHYLEPAAVSDRQDIRDAALRLRGQAEFRGGSLENALSSLERSESTGADIDRARVLAALNRVEESRRTLLAAVGNGRFVEQDWSSALSDLGGVNVIVASEVLDTLRGNTRLTRGQEARLLMQDAARLYRAEMPEASIHKYGEAAEVAGDSAESRLASVHMVMARVMSATAVDSIPGLLREMSEAAVGIGLTVPGAPQTLRALRRAVADSGSGDRQPLNRFQTAEVLRDSANARGLASAVFVNVATTYPDSPIAAKALIAAAMIDPEHSQGLLVRARAAYPDSPYVLALRGVGHEEFAMLEDSLRTLMQTAPPSVSSDDEEGLLSGELAEDDAEILRGQEDRRQRGVDP